MGPAAVVPVREPLAQVLTRNLAIALVIGGVLPLWFGGLAAWPLTTAIAFWFSFGGHVVEIFFLNVLRPRLPASRVVHALARVATWFVGGAILGGGAGRLMAFPGAPRQIAQVGPMLVVIGGVALIGIELVAHAGLAVRRKANVFDGRG